MNRLMRYRVIGTLSGAALLIGACTSPTEPRSRDEFRDGAMDGSSDEKAPSTCNYGDVWHCEAAEEGWSWVDHPDGHSCCENTGPEQPPRPYGT